MKSRFLSCITVVTLFAALTIPAGLAAQEETGQGCDFSVERFISPTDRSSAVPERVVTPTQDDRTSPSEADPVMVPSDVTDDAPGTLLTVATGGTPPQVKLSPTALGFFCFPDMPVCICLGGPKKITLTNLGPTVLHITGITISGHFSQTRTCGTTLGVGESCTISVTWLWRIHSPRLTFGALSVFDNGLGSPQKVSLSGDKLCGP